MKHTAPRLTRAFALALVMSAFLFVVSHSPVLADRGEPDDDDSGGGAALCIGSHSFSSFNGLVVPKGQTCQLDSFNVVNGDIKVRKGASLIVCPDNDIRGDVRADKPNTVFITDQTIAPCGSVKALGITIGGDVKVSDGGSVTLFGNPSGVAIIEGDVEVKNVQAVEIRDFNGFSAIRGDVRVRNSGNVIVTDNDIGGDLTIRGTSGACLEAGNSVGGELDSCP